MLIIDDHLEAVQRDDGLLVAGEIYIYIYIAQWMDFVSICLGMVNELKSEGMEC